MAGVSDAPHPRPQMERSRWICLDGPWDFVFDVDAQWRTPTQVPWGEKTSIQVPFAPETAASGIGDTSFFQSCWYRRQFRVDVQYHERLLLHFEAVDYSAEVWVNGLLVGRHEGGYTPFSIDITDSLIAGDQEVIVCARDDPHDLSKPRGKQDWQLQPHSIWYPRTTGIWQTVWLEPVPHQRIDWLRWSPCLDRWEIGLE